MKLSTKEAASPVGLHITFATAPVSRFHIQASLPDPANCYLAEATITMPEDRKDLWFEGVNAAIHRIQHKRNWAIRLDYDNAMRYFNMVQLEMLSKQNPSFSFNLYSVPEGVVKKQESALLNLATTKDFARLYYRQRKEARNGTIRERDISVEKSAV